MGYRTEAKRRAILKEASELFRSLGFERTSMSEICSRVGGSKSTIYKYFSSKEDLFTEVIVQATEAEFVAVHGSLDSSAKNIGESLRYFGERFLAFLFSAEVEATWHMAIAQSRRSEIGRLFYRRGVLRSHTLIAQFLQRSMSAGELRQADPDVATRHLVSLLESEMLDRFLYDLPGEMTETDIRERTARAVDVFMAAYGAGGKGYTPE